MRIRFALVTVASVLALSACAPVGGGPGGSGDPSGAQPGAVLDADAAWLHGGSMIGVLTWGSSSCPLWADRVELVEGVLHVDLVGPDASRPCTDDLAPRIAPIALPEGVDSAADLRIAVTAGDASASLLLEGDPRLSPHGSENWEPSAGWFDDLRSMALLTFGSSSCPPVIDTVEITGDAELTATVAEPEPNRPCTMDMAPRVTYLQLEQEVPRPGSTELVITGAEFDGVRIPVLGFDG